MNCRRTEQVLSPLDLSGRSDKVRSQISKSEAVVVMDSSNVQWMTGFTGSNGTVYIDHERFVLITDQRYQEQGPLQIMQSRSTAELSISKNSIEDLSKLAGRKTIKLDSNQVTWATAVRLGEILEGKIVPSDPLRSLRAQKDQCEIDRISLAAKIADQALKDTVPLFSQKVSEVEIAAYLDNKIREYGASESAYKTIVAAGVNSSKPHAQPSEKQIYEGDMLIIDVGAVVDGYRSDMTRTFVIGKPTDLQENYLGTVLEAQQEGIKILEPGMPCSEIDQRCRSKIEEAGWGPSFIHGTGHGVGLDIHESPSINSQSKEKLLTGMVVTIEPGIYFTDSCGVRWEDLYEITENGARQLTLSSKSPEA